VNGRSLLGLALLALGLLVAACAAPGAPARPVPAEGQAASAPTVAPVRVRSAYVSIAGNMLPAWIAEDQGLFQKHGLDVELTYIAGAAKMSEALIAGELDVAVTPASSAMGPGLEGADLVMVASWSDKLAFSALAQPAIQTPADLRGKRLGITRRGSNSEIWGTAVLGPLGMEPDRDFTYLSMGGQAEQLAGLQNGAIDAAILTPPTNLTARKLGYREVLSYKDYRLEFANVGAVVNRRYVREQADTLDRTLRALAEGTAVLLRDPETTLAVLGRYTKTDDRELLEETLAFERSRTARDMVPTPAGLRAALDELANTNPKAAAADPLSFVDLGPIQRLNDSGFIASLYP
jgi:NitT/TauT family transport system substrate-binding protein